MTFAELHGYVIGITIMASWAAVCLAGLGLRLARREEAGWFWRLVSVAQVLLVVQLVVGVVLLLMGRRPGDATAFTTWFHFFYGFGFPLIVLLFAHKKARDGTRDPFTIFSVASLVIFALTLRGFQVGLVGA